MERRCPRRPRRPRQGAATLQLVSTGIEEAMRDGVMMLPVRTGKMVFEHGVLECPEKSYTSYTNVMVAYVTNMMTIPPYSYTTPNEKLACSAANPHAHARAVGLYTYVAGLTGPQHSGVTGKKTPWRTENAKKGANDRVRLETNARNYAVAH
ncbi:hypothetical protein EV424DRAFT_1556530 [Suillus variegatus]|nr:hypothetical protein EV424DRAFT_1556530 [Suillus variegatus]